MDGEVIQKADPHIGLLHRATEKLAESKPFNQTIGYMDRLDYVSMMCNEHAYVMAIERLLGIEPTLRAKYIRVMFDEVTRILNHLMWLGSHALDIGALTVFLYCFREREDLMDCYEAVSGTRMHATYYRPGGVYRDLPEQMPQYQPSKWRSQKDVDKLNERRSGSLLDFLEDFTRRFPKCVDEYETLLTDNRIWKQRTVNIGVVSPERAMQLGFSGPMLRGSGIVWDLRKKQPYEVYEHMDFDIPVGVNGDCYDRYLVRIEEFRQSNNIVKQCIDWLRANPGPDHDRGSQDHAALARADERRHGIAHSSLQALHRGLQRSGGRSVRRDRGAEGRARRLSRVGRREQALSAQGARAGICASRQPGRNGPRAHARGCRRRDRHAGHRFRRDRSLMANETTSPTTLSPHVREEIDHWVKKFPPGRQRSAVLSALRAAQHENGGYLTAELMDAVAAYLQLPPIQVYEVATFYSMFETRALWPASRLGVHQHLLHAVRRG